MKTTIIYQVKHPDRVEVLTQEVPPTGNALRSAIAILSNPEVLIVKYRDHWGRWCKLNNSNNTCL